MEYGATPSPAVPDAAPALDEDDAIEPLGDEIALLAAHIHTATHRMLVLIADFDGGRGWERDGHRSCAHWLAFRKGIDLGAAAGPGNVNALVDANRRRGVLPDWRTAGARWTRIDDVPDAVLFSAMEASG